MYSNLVSDLAADFTLVTVPKLNLFQNRISSAHVLKNQFWELFLQQIVEWFLPYIHVLCSSTLPVFSFTHVIPIPCEGYYQFCGLICTVVYSFKHNILFPEIEISVSLVYNSW